MKYDEPGEYTLTYTATDDCGNTATEERQVTVTEPASDYPYTLARFSAWEFEGSPEGGGTIPNEVVTILDTPRAEYEIGEALIKNFVVGGNNLGDVTVEVDVGLIDTYDKGELVLDTGKQVAPIGVEWTISTKEVTYAYIDSDGSGVTPTSPFSWDSIVVTITG